MSIPITYTCNEVLVASDAPFKHCWLYLGLGFQFIFPYILAEYVPNGGAALLHGPPDPQRLEQLGVGDDKVLPVDEEDGDLLLAQHVGGPNRPNEHLVVDM